jgi:NAD+ synthase (glutamine-hydrolysing)
MAQMRLALAQINPTVGDLGGNARAIRAWTDKAAKAGAHLVAFPEMVLTGYPVEDLALHSSFVQASRTALAELATDLASDGHGDLPVVVGYLDQAPYNLVEADHPLPQNCAAVLYQGKVKARYAKHHLPNYGVFDEFRIFAPGRDLTVLHVGDVEVAIAICEDLWQEGGPVAQTRQAGAGLLLVINGSPYEQHKDDVRYELVARRAAEAGCTLAYLNMVGGQDELVFDGDSLVVDRSGKVLARGPQFEEDLLVVDLELKPSTTKRADHSPSDGIMHVTITDTPTPAYARVPSVQAARLDPVGEVYRAVQLGLNDYVRKNGFRSVLLGVSGGIDSTLVATIASDALGGANVVAISNPSKYSSQGSMDDAAELAQNLGLDYRVIPIEPMVAMFLDTVKLTGVAQENLQARMRALIWMGLGNQEGHLVLANSNKSEVSVGYSTIYGDSVGGFAPIKDVPKTMVWELARWRNAEAVRRGEKPPIPAASISKAPSAELRHDQTDQDSLPPYALLDDILDRYVEEAQSRAELDVAGFDPAVVEHVISLVDRAEWKRRQFAPGPKISALAFGRDRRLPITNRWREPY